VSRSNALGFSLVVRGPRFELVTDMSQPSVLTHAEVTMLMRFALGEAEHGLAERAIPIGCVAAALGEHGLRIVGKAHETTVLGPHAVTAVLAAASTKMRANDAGLIVVSTVEPCAECMEACRAASVREVICGLSRRHAESGAHRIDVGATHKSEPPIVSGVIAEESRKLLQSFVFRSAGLPRAIAHAEQLLLQGAA
jgi:tRNA(Arg) A34 adenosine deaminase TadA